VICSIFAIIKKLPETALTSILATQSKSFIMFFVKHIATKITDYTMDLLAIGTVHTIQGVENIKSTEDVT
jgi:hypothetical protein